jgi:hypothetical protein
VLISIAWDLYVDLHLWGSISRIGVARIIITLVLWGGAAALLIGRTSWARTATRVLAVLVIIGSVDSMWSRDGLVFWAAMCRGLAFAAVFVLLRAPARKSAASAESI